MSGGLGARLFVAGDVITAADVNGYLMNQSMMRFPTTAARDTAFGNGIPVGQTENGISGDGKPLLQEGMFAYIDSNNDVQYFTGSQWLSAPQFVIGDGEVTTIKLADNAVTGAKIADNSITAAHIADGTIIAADIADGSVTSAKIADGTIVNADINASAAIDKTKISGTAITASDTGTVTSTMIADGTIMDADINSSAAIDKTKISGTAVTVADTGTVTSTMIADGTVVNADINSSAAIDLNKLADATIDTRTANYSLVLTDKNKFIKMNSSSNRTITVPLQATVNFPEGSQIHIIRYGSGTLEIVGESGAVIIYATPGKFLRDRYSTATLLKCADTNVWLLMGDLSTS